MKFKTPLNSSSLQNDQDENKYHSKKHIINRYPAFSRHKRRKIEQWAILMKIPIVEINGYAIVLFDR